MAITVLTQGSMPLGMMNKVTVGQTELNQIKEAGSLLTYTILKKDIHQSHADAEDVHQSSADAEDIHQPGTNVADAYQSSADGLRV
jgi:hypothetical protein